MNEEPLTDKEKRRLSFLEADNECFGLTSGEECELNRLKAKAKRPNSHLKVNKLNKNG